MKPMHLLLLRWYRKNRDKPYARMALAVLLSRSVERPLVPDVRFKLLEMSDADAVLSFRFDVDGIQRLRTQLGIPHVIVTVDRFPTTYYDMMSTFGRSRPQLCRIFYYVVDLIYRTWWDIIYFAKVVDRQRIQAYAEAIHRRGAPTTNVFAFVDGTKVPTCRISAASAPEPDMNLQRLIYSGHKRRHCLVYQGLTAPDGLCIHVYGPVEGRRHDTTVMRFSKLLQFFEGQSLTFEEGADGEDADEEERGQIRTVEGRPQTLNDFMIYGDPAYGISNWVMVGYKGNNVNWQKKEFNRSMSQVRQSVEWNFGRMKTLWASLQFTPQQKIMLSPVGKIVKVAMFLTNLNCCYYGGNQTSDYFGLVPPTLEEYLSR
ncbi:hypothetical protein SDRG_15498 [Saprolegnia diclina VS20]|uniref:DDE Tnp4 domain-containing protein n=1 Tax=Saprolegnia diclina (strain VS20) TaxID=1156394 RepID=T0PV10_SAPDV|nr:hypothetical protein SDRG_15498 [Saprolegnia diclina VS20]XP_008621729.1 hypothetical protein SDRG_17267 [Saprolegnia diclina VS20]EQC24845.1 hypothetical protein SDRG_17267 [Saprolegnia diclina VS20]EQC26660.1 hypothetical protein SDRG_15498 [Saprolegnia diclina VS20]|eukprot:XP_008619895.1 hypothetical protein SDRG_15498 [Saprolegnia diclina VS20]